MTVVPHGEPKHEPPFTEPAAPPGDPYRHTCSSRFPAYHHSGARIQQSIRYIVLHSTEGPTAEGAASYFMSPDSGGSANLVVDDRSCYRSLGDFVVPWGAPPLNANGFHIEQAGYAAWSREDWLAHEETIVRAAYKAALRCRWYKIPPRLLDVAALERDFGTLPVTGDSNTTSIPYRPGPLEGGIVTHATISAAYRQSDHTDPGAGYPADVFMQYLHRWLEDKNL